MNLWEPVRAALCFEDCQIFLNQITVLLISGNISSSIEDKCNSRSLVRKHVAYINCIFYIHKEVPIPTRKLKFTESLGIFL